MISHASEDNTMFTLDLDYEPACAIFTLLDIYLTSVSSEFISKSTYFYVKDNLLEITAQK